MMTAIAEIDIAALAVPHLALVEDLIEHILDARMRLLHLVEQDHRIGSAADGLGQHATFAIADITGWRAHQQRDLMLFLELAHVDDGEVMLAAIEEIGDGKGRLGLADARRAGHQKDADRFARIGQAGPARADGLRNGIERVVLPDDALAKRGLQGQDGLDLVRYHSADRHARPGRDDLGNRLPIDGRVHERFLALQRAQSRRGSGKVGLDGVRVGALAFLGLGRGPLRLVAQIADPHDEIFFLRPAIVQRRRLALEADFLGLQRRDAGREVGSGRRLATERRHLGVDQRDTARAILDRRRHGGLAHRDAGAGGVQQRNALVRQLPRRDEARGQLDRIATASSRMRIP